MNIWYPPWFHSANNKLYIKLRTQVTSRVPYCWVRDKTFTSLNIVKHVNSSFENPYTVWGCIFKATGETLRNEPDDEVMWRHLTTWQSHHRRESASKQWLHQQQNMSIQFDSVKRLTLRSYQCRDFRQGLVKVNLCFLKPVIPWQGLNLNILQWAQ